MAAVVLHTMVGLASLSFFETRGTDRGRWRVEVDGKQRHIRARKVILDVDTPQPGSYDWTEGYDADLDVLARCYGSEHRARTEEGGKVTFEMTEYGLSGVSATSTAVVSLEGDFVVVDMTYRNNELNPGVGW